jgi:hypothetical protein
MFVDCEPAMAIYGSGPLAFLVFLVFGDFSFFTSIVSSRCHIEGMLSLDE